jgi:iron(III) transport system substrate-binding protein
VRLLVFLVCCAASWPAAAQLPSPVVDGERIATPDLVSAACAEG